VSYVSEWMLFGSNKFSGMTVKEDLTCLISILVCESQWISFCRSRICTVRGSLVPTPPS